MRSLKRKKIVTYGIPLLNDGCYATEIDYENLIRVMESFSGQNEQREQGGQAQD